MLQKARSYRFIWLLGLIGLCCSDHSAGAPPDISGVYVLHVTTKYGATADTLEVSKAAGERVYSLMHKIEFTPNEHDLKHNRTFRVERHVALFEEHQSILQDTEDGSVFLINYRNLRSFESEGMYAKIR